MIAYFSPFVKTYGIFCFYVHTKGRGRGNLRPCGLLFDLDGLTLLDDDLGDPIRQRFQIVELVKYARCGG